ncbi:MAG: hypothetical protein FWF28_04210 [Micrococcales bacterium]|nr:hypothetical protein [Micrococcales bacterium]
MSMLVYDAGAFIAVDRGERAMWTRIKAALSAEEQPVTSTAVVAQVWRGDACSERLARLVGTVHAVPLTEPVARAVGTLLARSGTSDVVNAALILTATDGDMIYTSDPEDLAHLAATRNLHVEIVPV